MGKRIAAIVLIFICTTVAWMVLGATIFSRTYDFSDRLRDRVASNWGTEQVQQPPDAHYYTVETRTATTVEDGKSVVRTSREAVAHPLSLDGSNLNVDLKLEHRQKGLLWYATYRVAFDGTYQFTNPSSDPQEVTFKLPFPAQQAIYDDVVFTVDGAKLPIENTENTASVKAMVGGGRTATLHVGYKSQGLDQWSYKFGENVAHVRNFALTMTTDFSDINFPDNTLSPTEKQASGHGWRLLWRFNDLLSGFSVAMEMPQKLQPGPLAGQISLFAPVSLFFFFFLMFIITTLRGIDLHPMNYFFLAAAFFAFHLLLAYTVDHMSIHAAFLLSSAVSVFLVVSYLRLVVGLRFAAVEAALAQLIYLVLFSYAFFFKGFTGLAITVGSIVTLFVVMQMTGRIRWTERFAARAAMAGKA